MCRLLGYMGHHPLLMNSLLDHYDNSLIVQSKHARETSTGLNGDGFGLGWYDHTVDPLPALFKSIQPAWNDLNLTSLSQKVRSKCFVGHIRASTVGDVSRANSHPFAFGTLLCAHNGTLKEFPAFKRPLVNLLDDFSYQAIKGTTDSEHLFALIHTYLSQTPDLIAAIRKALFTVHDLQKLHTTTTSVKANLLLTDGHEMVALRYCSSKEHSPLSLYYSNLHIEPEGRRVRFLGNQDGGNGVVISSEHLTEDAPWCEVPHNTFLHVSPTHTITLLPF